MDLPGQNWNCLEIAHNKIRELFQDRCHICFTTCGTAVRAAEDSLTGDVQNPEAASEVAHRLQARHKMVPRPVGCQ